MAAAEETVVVPAKKKSGKLGILVVLSVVVLSAAGGGFLWLRHRPTPSAPETPKVNKVLHLETFILNLADEDQRTFLKIGIDLGLASNEKKPKEGEAETSNAPVRDVILSVLMATHSTDISTPEGQQKLKDKLIHDLNEHLPELKVHEIYFTEFLIQR